MATTTPLTRRLCWVLAFCASITLTTRADQVVMQNGDRYNGKVLSVTTTNVVFQSEMLGVVTLSRAQVANVAMGLATPTNAAPVASAAKTNSATDLSASLRQLGSQSNLVQQVQAQFLSAASPEANAKFTQMLNELSTGKMSVGDLRAEAKAAAAQLRELEKEAGEDAGGMIEMYLSILDGFVQQTEAASGPAPVKPGSSLKR